MEASHTFIIPNMRPPLLSHEVSFGSLIAKLDLDS